MDPEDLLALGDEMGYQLDLGWSNSDPTGCYDVLFSQRGLTQQSNPEGRGMESSVLSLPSAGCAVEAVLGWAGSQANNPLHGRQQRALLPGLRRFLHERLPDYMIPSAFVVLDALPLTANGKIDRKALPAPDSARPELAAAYLAPRNEVEETLAGIWAEVLGLQRVGVQDNFFELGGHSLLATQVASRLRQTFEVELPLRLLFEEPTLAGLAAAIQARRSSSSAGPPLTRQPRDMPLPLSFAQQRLWFLDQMQPGNPFYNIPIALRIWGPLDTAVLQRCLAEVVRRHEALRTTFAAPEGRPVQVIAPSLALSLSSIDLSVLPQEQCQSQALRLAAEEARQPFDLEQGPLLRGCLLRLAEDEHVALFTMHHIVADGWSVGVLIQEVAQLYPALAAGRPAPLPELPVQYADFAFWQRQWLQGEQLQSQLAYWRERLAGLSPLELPTDRPRPALQSFRGASLPVLLSGPLSQGLQALSRREGVTLFMTLLAAFQTLLCRYSGQEDVAVGSAIANRNRAETEGLIGFFVNMLVLRSDLSGDPTFRALLQRVREVALGAYAHQDLPFEKLVEELQPERDLSRQPLFQVGFVLQNTPLPRLELPGLRIAPLEIDNGTSKFDLTLMLRESAAGAAGDAGVQQRVVRPPDGGPPGGPPGGLAAGGGVRPRPQAVPVAAAGGGGAAASAAGVERHGGGLSSREVRAAVVPGAGGADTAGGGASL